MMKKYKNVCIAQTNIHPSFDATSYPQERVFWSGIIQSESQKLHFGKCRETMNEPSLKEKNGQRIHPSSLLLQST